MADYSILAELHSRIEGRKDADPSRSYVAKLLKKGRGKITQKLGEEAVETIIAALHETEEHVVSEAADMLFHLFVLCVEMDIDPTRIMAELETRLGISGLDEKAARKMQD